MSTTIENASSLLETVAILEKELARLKQALGVEGVIIPNGKKARKPKKERDPDAPPAKENPFFAFLNGRVRPLLKEAGHKVPGTIPTLFAKHLKEVKEYDTWKDAEILEAFTEWGTEERLEELKKATARKSKKDKESDAGSEAGESEASEKPKKPRKERSEEEKAATAAKRKATLEAKKAKVAEKPAEEAEAESEDEEAPPPAPKAAEKPAPKPAEKPKFGAKKVEKKWSLEELQDFDEWEHDGVTYGKNARGDVADGKGKWVGHWDGKTLNKEAAQPAEWSKIITW
jgi:hypothetical protein